MVKRFVSIFPEKFSQKPVPVGMVADFQYRIQQRGDRYGTCRSPAGQLDVRFRYPDFFFFSIAGIHAGAGDCLAMIVCCILLLFKL